MPVIDTPLSRDAFTAWNLSHAICHDPNYGIMLAARSALDRYKTHPHPLIRRIATEPKLMFRVSEGGGDAA